MQRLADGQRAAFDEVYAALQGPVRRFAARLVGDQADDVAQQTLVKLFGQATQFRPEHDVLQWAFAIALWECRTLRKRGLRRREEPLVDAPTAETPERALQEAEVMRAAAQAWAALSEADRAVLREALDEDGPARSAAFRKKKQRAIERMRALWSK